MTAGPGFRRSTIWIVAAAAGLLAAAVGLAVLSWSALDLTATFGWMVLAAGMIVIIVRIAMDGHARRIVRGVTAGTALVVVAAMVTVLTVPLELRRAEYTGHGVIWTSDLDVSNSKDFFQPFAVLDESVVLQGVFRTVILGMADGRVRAEIPFEAKSSLQVAGTRLLVRSPSKRELQAYDAEGRPFWPKPIRAEAALAASGDVIVLLTGCDDAECSLAGYRPGGQVVWQRRLPRTLALASGHPPVPNHSGPIRLPELLAVEDSPRPPADQPMAPRWTIIRATDGKEVGRTPGEVVIVVGSTPYVVTRDGSRCWVSADQASYSGEPFVCDDPLNLRLLGDRLLIFKPLFADRKPVTIQLDRPSRPYAGLDPAALDGLDSDADLGDRGWSRLTNRVLESWAFDAADHEPSWRSAPLPIVLPDDTRRPMVAVDGNTVAVAGDAEPRHGDHRPETQLIIFDFNDGAETGRIRLRNALSRSSILSTGSGQALICPIGQPPMLIGKRT